MTMDLEKGVSTSLCYEDGQFLGLGEISVRGVALRCGRVPIAPLIETLEGLQFRTFDFRERIELDGEVLLRCRAKAVPGEYTERTDLLHHRGLATYFPEEMPVAEIDWILRPVEAEIGGRRFVGLSYRYAFRCPGDRYGRVHQVVDRTSWEIGGRAEGNTVISVGQANFPEHQATRGSAFDTRVAQRGPHGERLHPGYASYETSPRFGTMQCFDYLFADDGALAIYYERMEHIRGLVEKRADSDLILHFDEISFPLANEFETPAKHVLFYPVEQPLDTATARNIWTDVHDHVATLYRSQYGIRAEEPAPEFSFGYDYDPVRRTHVVPDDSTQHMQRLGRELIPRLAALGFKRFFISPTWITDMTEVATGGNCCLAWDYRVAERFGGNAALAELCQCADRAGIQVTVWIAFSLSDRSPLAADHPDWNMQSVTGAAYKGGCKDGVICIDPRSDFRRYLTDLILALKRDTGIHGVLHDSYVHVPTMVINQADPELTPSHGALLEMVAELQRSGLVYTVEGNGPFGLARGGLSHLSDGGPEVMLQYFFGREYALYSTTRNVSPDAVALGILTPERYFRFLANKAPFCFELDPCRMDKLDCLEGNFARLHQVFNKVAPLMCRRNLLDDDAGVEWQADDGGLLLFAFREFHHPLPAGSTAEEVTEGAPTPVAIADGGFRTREGGVYQVHATV